jgi:hypothetical protein
MLGALLDAVIDTFKTTPGVDLCEHYAGQLGGDGQVQKMLRTPALLLALLKAPPSTDPGTGQVGVDAHLALYVVARNAKSAEARGRDALALVEHLLPQIRHNKFGLGESVGVAEITDVRPHYLLDGKGFAIWEINWTQWAAIGESVWDGDVVIPEEVLVGYDPQIGPAFLPDYETVVSPEV